MQQLYMHMFMFYQKDKKERCMPGVVWLVKLLHVQSMQDWTRCRCLVVDVYGNLSVTCHPDDDNNNVQKSPLQCTVKYFLWYNIYLLLTVIFAWLSDEAFFAVFFFAADFLVWDFLPVPLLRAVLPSSLSAATQLIIKLFVSVNVWMSSVSWKYSDQQWQRN